MLLLIAVTEQTAVVCNNRGWYEDNDGGIALNGGQTHPGCNRQMGVHLCKLWTCLLLCLMHVDILDCIPPGLKPVLITITNHNLMS